MHLMCARKIASLGANAPRFQHSFNPRKVVWGICTSPMFLWHHQHETHTNFGLDANKQIFKRTLGFNYIQEKLYPTFSSKEFSFFMTSKLVLCNFELWTVRTQPYLKISEMAVVSSRVTKLQFCFLFYSCAGYIGDGEHEAINVTWRMVALFMQTLD